MVSPSFLRNWNIICFKTIQGPEFWLCGWLHQPWKNWFTILDIIFYNLMGAHNFLVPEISATSHYNLFPFFWPASISLLFTCHSCRKPMFNYRFGCPPAIVLNIIHLFLEFLKKTHDFLHDHHLNKCLTTCKHRNCCYQWSNR